MGMKLAGLMAVVLVTVLGLGYWYYSTSQATIATLRENNAQLEVAVQTAQDSIESLQQDMAKFQELNLQLQEDLKAAEAYGDELQAKLRKLDLVQDAIKDPKTLEGKMNGATAKLWRGITEDTGGDGSRPLPTWLQSVPSGTGDQSSNQDREDTSTSGEPSQANSAQ